MTFPTLPPHDASLDPNTSFPLDDGSVAVALHDAQGMPCTLTLDSARTPPGLLSLALAALGHLLDQGVCLLRVRDGYIERVPPSEIAVVDQAILLLPPHAIEHIDEEKATALVDLTDVTILHRTCSLVVGEEVALSSDDTVQVAHLLDRLRAHAPAPSSSPSSHPPPREPR